MPSPKIDSMDSRSGPCEGCVLAFLCKTVHRQNGFKDGFFAAEVVHVDKAMRKPTIGLQRAAIDIAPRVIHRALQHVGRVEWGRCVGAKQPLGYGVSGQLLSGHLVLFGFLEG